MRNYFIALLAVLTLFSACKKDDPTNEEVELKDGVFIVNQGTFTASNASLSYFDYASGTIQNDLFYSVNNTTLGDVAQSITINNNVAYIVVNNSGLVYGIDTKTAEYKGKIENLTSPRHMLILNDQKAYISDLYSKELSIVNPSTFEVTGNVPLGYTSEELVKIGSEVFVANWSAYTQEPLVNNNVIVVDSESDQVTDTIKVGVEPNSMVVDKNNNLWVLCSGGYNHVETASLWKIDGSTHDVLDSLIFSEVYFYPSNLEINGTGDTLFYLRTGIFKMPIDATALPGDEFVKETEERDFIFLGVDPVKGDIFASDPLDNLSAGKIYHFSSKGSFLPVTNAGIVPGAFGFNY